MLKVKNLHVQYGAFQALMGISLEVKQGEIVALLGGNGAGKSTTINTIAGLVQETSGTISFEGVDLKGKPASLRASAGITLVPEGRKLFPNMTVLDNMLVGSYLKKARTDREENLSRCFELFPKLYERKSQMAGSLSGGEQQMCAIARGLMQFPKLLMLDEPSLGLAPVIVDTVFEVIQKVNNQGMTILIVEQNVLASLEIATRGYVIETGQNVINGDSAELMYNQDIKKAYIGI